MDASDGVGFFTQLIINFLTCTYHVYVCDLLRLSLPPPAAVPAAAAPSSSAASALGNIDFQSLFAGAAAPVPPTAGATTTT